MVVTRNLKARNLVSVCWDLLIIESGSNQSKTGTKVGTPQRQTVSSKNDLPKTTQQDTEENNKHYCQGKTSKTNYSSTILSHMQEQNKPVDLTKYIWTITAQVIRHGQECCFLCISLNSLQNSTIWKVSAKWADISGWHTVFSQLQFKLVVCSFALCLIT